MIFLPREEGQGLVEYALIILFIAIVVVAALLMFGQEISDLYDLFMDEFLKALG